MKVLCTKHPDSLTPSLDSLDSYTGQTTELVSVEIYRRHGHGDIRTPLRRFQSRGGGLSETVTLATEVCNSKQGDAADGDGLHGVASKRAAPLGHLLGSYELNIYCTGQATRSQAGQGGRNLAPTHGEVCLAGDEARSQGHMWDGAYGGRIGSGNWRGDTCCAPPMGTALPGGGLGVSPH